MKLIKEPCIHGDLDCLDCDRERCSKCQRLGAEPRNDRYGIYAGRFCDKCWRSSGIRTWKYDPADAGESLEEI